MYCDITGQYKPTEASYASKGGECFGQMVLVADLSEVVAATELVLQSC